jgi:hypothetical protein
MVKRTSILVTIIVTFHFSYAVFRFISFFNNTPKYHFRIAYIFVDVPFVFEMIALFQFIDPLKASMMKKK